MFCLAVENPFYNENVQWTPVFKKTGSCSWNWLVKESWTVTAQTGQAGLGCSLSAEHLVQSDPSEPPHHCDQLIQPEQVTWPLCPLSLQELHLCSKLPVSPCSFMCVFSCSTLYRVSSLFCPPCDPWLAGVQRQLHQGGFLGDGVIWSGLGGTLYWLTDSLTISHIYNALWSYPPLFS